jgi:hypothetical protein
MVDKVTGARQRVKLPKEDVNQEMIRHSPAQRRFDGLANEWDICTEFGSWGDYDEKWHDYHEGDSDMDSDNEDYDDNIPPIDPGPYELPPIPPFPSDDIQISPASPTPTDEGDFGTHLTYPLTGKMANRLPLIYGIYFTAISTTLPSVGTEHQKIVYRAFGGESQPKPLPDLPVNCLLYQLLLCMLRYEDEEVLPSTALGLCDLHPASANLQAIITATVRVGRESSTYLISPVSTTPGPTIVVYDPEAAVLCCRLEDTSFENMVKNLFRNGIRFNACLPTQSVLPPAASEFIFAAVPPVIAPGLPLDKAVYDRFVEHRRLFLVGHRRRAALLLGGLFSRIARDVIGNDAECERLILEGPSPNVFDCAENVVECQEDGTLLCDDILSILEKDYILGIHYQIDSSCWLSLLLDTVSHFCS